MSYVIFIVICYKYLPTISYLLSQDIISISLKGFVKLYSNTISIPSNIRYYNIRIFNINYSIILKILQTKLVNLQILEFSLAILGVELHILVWSYREHEVGHGDATAIYEEFNR